MRTVTGILWVHHVSGAMTEVARVLTLPDDIADMFDPAVAASLDDPVMSVQLVGTMSATNAESTDADRLAWATMLYSEIHPTVDDKHHAGLVTAEMYDWLAEGDDTPLTLAQLAALWREYTAEADADLAEKEYPR